MAGTFSQIYIQLVFAVKGRDSLLKNPWRKNVIEYIGGIIREKGQKVIIVNAVSDHIHIFFGMKPNICISDLVREIKSCSSKRINEAGWCTFKFAWQKGYAAFSYSHKQVKTVYNYIANQEEHHRIFSFKDEYLKFLMNRDIDYQEKHLFE